MAQLPIKCGKCGKTVMANTDSNGMMCTFCGEFINTYKAVEKQHPKWVDLIKEEKKLYTQSNGLRSDNNFSKDPFSQKMRKGVLVGTGIFAVLTSILYISLQGSVAPDSTEEVIVFFIVLFTGAFLIISPFCLPGIILKFRSRHNAQLDEYQTKIAQRLSEILVEKEAYLKEVQDKAES